MSEPAIDNQTVCVGCGKSVRFAQTMGEDMRMVDTCPSCGMPRVSVPHNVVPIAKAKIAGIAQPIDDYVSAMRQRAHRLEQEITDIGNKKRELAKIRRALRVFDHGKRS